MALKVAFIGAGGIAGAHMPNVDDRDETRISAICDINEERAREAAQTYEATPYTDYEEMLEAEQIDAAYVCLPPAAHGRIELDLVEHGIPFCVEKPVNLDLETAVRVAKAVEDADLVTSVGYQVRYAPQVEHAADFLSTHPVSLVEGWFVGGVPPASWWTRKEISGGQAVEQTTHIFDLARALAGDVEEVCAYGSTGANTDFENYDIEDATVALLKFESGAVGHICSACVLNDGGSPHVGLRFDGRDYTVELTYGSLKIESGEDSREEDHSGVLGPAMRELDHTFLSAAESGDGSAVRCDYPCGLRSAALCIAVNASMKGGGPVRPGELLAEAGM